MQSFSDNKQCSAAHRYINSRSRNCASIEPSPFSIDESNSDVPLTVHIQPIPINRKRVSSGPPCPPAKRSRTSMVQKGLTSELKKVSKITSTKSGRSGLKMTDVLQNPTRMYYISSYFTQIILFLRWLLNMNSLTDSFNFSFEIESGIRAREPEKNTGMPSISDDQPSLIHRHNLNLRSRNCASIERSCCPLDERSRAVMVRKEPEPRLITAPKELLTEGTIVLAKMRTFAAWPARILSFGKSYIDVYFFGDGTTGHVTYDNVGLFQNNHKLTKFNLKKNIKGYLRAVLCTEGVLKIPQHLSILNVN